MEVRESIMKYGRGSSARIEVGLCIRVGRV